MTARSDERYWARRLELLAGLAALDAIAIVLPTSRGPYVFAAFGIGPADDWLGGPLRYIVEATLAQGTVQRRVAEIRLLDGRAADACVVLPIKTDTRTLGALCTMRAERPIEPTELGRLETVARIAALELEVSVLLTGLGPAGAEEEKAMADEDRRQALVLYELARLALGAERDGRAATLIADSLRYELVAIWRDTAGDLELVDAFGYPSDGPTRVDPTDDAVLLEVLRGQTRRIDAGAPHRPSWLAPSLDAALAPIGERSAVSGLLAIGRRAGLLDVADVAFAPALGEALALLFRPAALAALPERPLTAPTPGWGPGAAARPPVTASRAAAPPAAEPHPAPASPVETSAPQPATSTAPVTPGAAASDRASRRGWAFPAFLLSLVAAGLGIALAEPLAFVVAGVLLLAAIWAVLA